MKTTQTVWNIVDPDGKMYARITRVSPDRYRVKCFSCMSWMHEYDFRTLHRARDFAKPPTMAQMPIC